MLKSELIEAIAKFDDDAHVMIVLDGEDYEISKVEGTWDVDENQNIIDSFSMIFIIGEI